jgi:hypothetical protein
MDTRKEFAGTAVLLVLEVHASYLALHTDLSCLSNLSMPVPC